MDLCAHSIPVSILLCSSIQPRMAKWNMDALKFLLTEFPFNQHKFNCKCFSHDSKRPRTPKSAGTTARIQ